MHDNLSLIGEITAGAETEESVFTAQKLFAITEGKLLIMKYDPPRGRKADWDATLSEFVNTAFVGIGACGAKDAEGLKTAVTKLRAHK